MSIGRIISDVPKDQLLQYERLQLLFKNGVEVDQRNGYYHMW
jgi:hypothetical protein